MKKLLSDFSLVKYGLNVRLVNENDADFIYAIRTDEKLSRYVNSVSGTAADQKKWISEYKKREALGLDYYLIYYYEGKPIGVNRLYNITEDSFTFGSWVFIDGIPFFCSMASALIAREIAFDILGKEIEQENIGTHKDNKNVIYFSKLLGLQYTGTIMHEKGEYCVGYLTKDAFMKNKSNILRFIPSEQERV